MNIIFGGLQIKGKTIFGRVQNEYNSEELQVNH